MINEIVDRGIYEALESMMRLVVADLKEQLAAQGHVLTGRLLNSIHFEVQVTASGAVLQGHILMEEYGAAVDQGIKASRIPFGGQSGAKVSKYIQALIDFFKKRGLPTREATSAAFATAHVQKREGMPTRASGRFSRTGERTGFMTRTVEARTGHYLSVVQREAGREFEINLTNYFTGIVSKGLRA